MKSKQQPVNNSKSNPNLKSNNKSILKGSSSPKSKSKSKNNNNKSMNKDKKVVIKKSTSTGDVQVSSMAGPSKIIMRKDRSLIQLSQSLSERINMEREVRVKLEQISDEQLEKKQSLEKQIEQIRRKNSLRMKQLQQFQTRYLKKLNEEYLKDKHREQRLQEQWQKIKEEQSKIKETQTYKKAMQSEDWQQILKQKQKLEVMIRKYRKKQDLILKEQNPESIIRIEAERNKVKVEKIVVTQAAAPKVKADAKQIGNQYLQYAKKLKEGKEKPKIVLMDVSKKMIQYGGDMMKKISRNTGDLSKIRNSPNTTGKFQQSALKMPTFEIKDDEDTKKILNQIRSSQKNSESARLGRSSSLVLKSIKQ